MLKSTLSKLIFIISLLFSSLGLHAQSNQYLHFDGVDDYVALPNAGTSLNGSNTITMAGWFFVAEVMVPEKCTSFSWVMES